MPRRAPLAVLLVLAILCVLLLSACGSSATTPKAKIDPRPDIVPVAAIVTVCEAEPLPVNAKPCIPQSAVRPDGYSPESPPARSRFGLIGSSIHIDAVGLRFIEGFEGFGACPYWDAYGGVWTRGYGETEGIHGGSGCISRSYGEANLKYRLERFYAWSIRGLGVGFNQYEADALYSFVWNLGAGIFTGSLRRSIQHHRFAAILAYDHAGGVVLSGLSRRRRAEFALAHRTPLREETPAQRRARLHRALIHHKAYRTHVRSYLNAHRCRKARRPRPRPKPRTRRQKRECAIVKVHGDRVNREIRSLERRGIR